MPPFRDKNGNPNLRSFSNYGFYGGAALGVVTGVAATGPHFYEWSLWSIFGVMLGCIVLLGLIGHMAIALAYGSETSSGGDYLSSEFGDASAGDGGCGGDGGSGGD